MNAVTREESQVLELEAPVGVPQLPAAQAGSAIAVNSPVAVMLQARALGYSTDEISKMMDLQDRFEKREAEKAFNGAFAAFKAEAVEIIKRKQVSFANKTGGRTEYKHAELSDVVDASTPALSRHGLSVSWKVTKQESNWIEVTAYLKHELGHFETASLGGPPDQSGGKNAIQAFISAKTYLERQTMKAVCGLAEKGEDTDGRATDAPQPEANDSALKSWQETAMNGTAALRKRYDDNVPTDVFWTAHGPALRQAARTADGASK